MKCLLQVYVLDVWSPAGGAIFEDSGNFRRWGLDGGNRRLWLIPGMSSLSFCILPARQKWTAFSCHHDCSTSPQRQKYRAKWPWNETSKTMSCNKSFLL
jgi:hypothetical protein